MGERIIKNPFVVDEYNVKYIKVMPIEKVNFIYHKQDDSIYVAFSL